MYATLQSSPQVRPLYCVPCHLLGETLIQLLFISILSAAARLCCGAEHC